MSGLGLTNAVRMYQRGRDWRDDQNDRKRQRDDEVKKKAISDEAGLALKKAMTPPMIEVDGGTDENGKPMPKIAQPDPKWDREGAYAKALGDVADVYARHGDFDKFLAAEAKAAPIRSERRTKAIDTAMARYRADKDPIKLAQSVYPHVFDGVDITFAVKRGEGFEFSTSDGQKLTMKPDDLVEQIEYLRDPVAAAKYEAQTRWERIKAGIDRDKQIAVDQGKHKNALGLADAEAGHKRALEGLKNEHARGQIGLRNAGDLATARERGRQDGGGADGSHRLHSTRIDATGYVLGVFRDGTTKRLKIDGKPVRSSDYQRHINVLMKQLGESREGRRKSVEELRQQAEAMLLDGSGIDGEAGADYNHLWE